MQRDNMFLVTSCNSQSAFKGLAGDSMLSLDAPPLKCTSRLILNLRVALTMAELALFVRNASRGKKIKMQGTFLEVSAYVIFILK